MPILDAKSVQRLKDIKTKANGDVMKMNSLAKVQANSITDPQKAKDRFQCAMFYYGPFSQVTMHFLDRACELSSNASIKELKESIKIVAGFGKAVEVLTKNWEQINDAGKDFDQYWERIEWHNLY